MHHVPYSYKLHSGKTVVQHLYDTHYEGAEAVWGYARQWEQLKGAVDDQRYADVLAQLRYQAGQAEVWRDAVAGWFQKASGIPDARSRVGKEPNRFEAEAMKLEGYAVRDVTPWETASGGKAVACSGQPQCAAVLKFTGSAGWYTLRVRYFDQNNGVGRFRVLVGSQTIDEWVADDRVPNARLNSSTSALRVIDGVALRPGDEIRIEGVPNASELAALDYVEIKPSM
jgi:alpha-glucuronidase